MIRVEHREFGARRCAVVTLDRAERRNALTPGMLAELVAAVVTAGESGDGVLLCGAGRVFCSGFDLDLCREARDGSTLRLLLSGLSDACRAMRRHAGPVVIAAQGAAVAGGCALLGGGDVVVCDRGARLGYPVTRLGISPAVTVPFLRAAAGDGVARRLTLRPDLVTGEEACSLGLVHGLVDEPGGVLAEAERVMGGLLAKPAGALGATKAWLNSLEGSDRSGQIDRALEVSLGLTGGDEERAMMAVAFGGETR